MFLLSGPAGNGTLAAMPTALLFTGESRHDTVNRMVCEMAAALGRRGCAVHGIDLRLPGADRMVAARIESGAVQVVVSFTGFGLDRRVHGNLYDRPGLRLVSIYLDPLLLYWDQVTLPIGGRLITTSSPDDLEVCRRYRPDLRVALLPHSAPRVVPLPWGERDVPLLFAGSVVPPATLRAGWRDFGAAVEGRLAAILDQVRATPALPLDRAVCAVAAAEGLDLDSPARLHPYVATIDAYLRAETRWRAVESLRDRPLWLVGAGWDGLAEHGAIRHLGPLPNERVAALTGRARIVLNACAPWHGSHERLFQGMAAGSAVASTWSAFAAEAAFAPALTLSRPGGAGLAEAVGGLLDDPATAEGRAALGHRMFLAAETWDHRVARLFDLLAADGG